jgi:hypothetical protein
MTFHAVNGDRPGSTRTILRLDELDTPPVARVNKGDRGYSDQSEARVFHIGRSHREHLRRV